MASAGVRIGSVLSVVAILVAYWYRQQAQDGMRAHLQEVLSGLLRAERRVPQPAHERKVAVGFGGCLDMISSVDVLDAVGIPTSSAPAHVDDITSADDLGKIFAYFFQHGAAAERFVKNETLFHALTSAARQFEETGLSMGGNAPMMATRFQQEGCKVLLGARLSPSLMVDISKEIKVAGGDLDEDDVHLLLEYAKGAEWGQYSAPRANRFILHSDKNNPFLTSLEAFANELTLFSPTLLVVGGLQMMDNFPFKTGEREARLGKLCNLLATTPKDTRIHFELASFAEESCLRNVIDSVVYYSDSLGMNEQELPNLLGMLTNGTMTLISDPFPRVATALDQMRSIYRILRNTSESGGRRKLTRLHVHTLAFQAILTTRGSSWKNSMSAAAKASLTANRHTCGSNYIHTEKAKILMDESFSRSTDQGSERIPLEPGKPVSCWSEEDYDVCVAPVLVCTKVVQTGGGGDNISSAGLVLQI